MTILRCSRKRRSAIIASSAKNYSYLLLHLTMLVLGFLCNLAVRPVDQRYNMSDEELARERGLAAAGKA